MKYFNTLLIIATFFVAGSVSAQSTSVLNGKSYTYVMKNIDGSGEEIIDKMTFTNNQAVSERNSGGKTSTSGVIEKSTGASSNFEVTFKGDKSGTMKYTGVATGKSIDGTILVTNSNGTQTTMAFRGMLTEDWDKMIKEKKDYKENQN